MGRSYKDNPYRDYDRTKEKRDKNRKKERKVKREVKESCYA